MEIFLGRSVLGSADSDLFFYWSLFKLLDDNFGKESIMMSSDLHRPWLDLINALDDRISKSFFDQGCCSLSDSQVLWLGDLEV